MTIDATPPTAVELLELHAPEDAVLWAVERILVAARVAIQVANPELLANRNDDFLSKESLPRIWAAEDIARLADDLARAIARYRHTVRIAGVAQPDLPF